jgi:hypothetical protein
MAAEVRWHTLSKGDKKTVADPKDAAKNKKSKRTDKNDEKPTGYKSGQGHMGAGGKSGKENLGSEKPTDDENMGSQKPGADQKNRARAF